MTSRTFRYSSIRGSAVDGNPPGPFSIINEDGVRTSRTPKPASSFQTVQGFDAFNPQTNFHDPFNVANQNGIVFFPGSQLLTRISARTGVQQRGRPKGLATASTKTTTSRLSPRPARTARVVERGSILRPRRAVALFEGFNRQPHEPFGQPKLPMERFKHLPAIPRHVKKSSGK